MRIRQRPTGNLPFAQWLFLGIAALILGCSLGWYLYSLHKSIDSLERERLATQAEIIEKNVAPQLLLANRVIDGILNSLPSWRAEDDGFKHASRQLQVINDTLIGINPILVIQADGTVIASSNEKLIGMNFAHREYFKTAINNPDPAILHVSSPFRTALDTFVISLFRTILGPDGEFGGIVIVSAVPEYFSTLLDSVRYAPDMRVSIVHGDGKVFLNSPRMPGVEGMDLAKPGTFFTRHRDSGQPSSVFTGTVYSRGEDRMMAQRNIQLAATPMDTQLVAAVSRNLSAVFSDWRRDAFMRAGVFAALLLVAALGLFLYQKRQQAYDRLVADQEAERRQAEAALRESKQRYDNLVSKIPVGIYLLRSKPDGAFALDYASPRMAEMLELSVDSLLADSRTVFQAIHPDDRQSFIQLNQEGIQHRRPFDWTGRISAGKSLSWLHFASSPELQENGDVLWIGLVVDVTERKQAEAAHATLEAQLRESQKMEALGTLAGGVAHDFNNALAMIIGNVELARQDVGPGHAALVSLEEIGKASRRAKDLVQQILAFSRRQSLERKATSLALVVVESARLIRATLPAMVSLSVDCRRDTPVVLADAMAVKQILLNLCSNALDAIQDQGSPGEIEVRLEAYTQVDARGDLRPGRYACLTVRDNGSGMDEATRSRIFEPFFTTKPVGKGTGLGLSVVHGIVQAHEASMQVESSPGAGSTFRIYFPAADAQVAVETMPATDAAPVDGAGKHILYVDDEEGLILLMKRLLERRGYRVSGYTDPREALAAARAHPDQFDLVVTDYSMPGISGLDVAHALREIRADLPVVLASGYITEELRAKAPAAGIRELIYKPNTVDDLCEAVARLAQTTRKTSKSS